MTELESRYVEGGQPLVRTGLLEGYDRVDFRVNGAFTLMSLNGEIIFENITSTRRWRAKVENSTPAQFVYSIQTHVCDNLKDAEEIALRLNEEGHPAKILPYGRELVIGGKVVHEARKWRIIVGAFDSEEHARPNLATFAENDSERVVILRHRTMEPSGKIEVYDAEYEKNAMIEDGFRIIPENSIIETTVYGVQVGVGFHWEHTEDRVYRGIIEIRIDNSGNLMTIDELHLDDYLKGVVPSEMHSTYPMEALKAQAVAARSYTVAKLSNRPADDPIDFPATAAFQVFSGTTYESEATSQAVYATTGEVLKVNNQVCEAYFCANSGGHTESKENWVPPGESYLVGHPVMPESEQSKFELNLTLEKDVADWVKSHPENFSNPRGTNIEMLDKNVRYFRWDITYTRAELEEIIQRKLGFSIGTLIDIQPLKRGVSGRITELEILGTHRNYKLNGELNIRRALSKSTLYSSCFVVEMVMGELGHPVEITFIGAGFGHGVGMDQTAAGVMATKGFLYQDILGAFYQGARVERIW